MSVTIGAFSTNRLTAQPFGYEGEARTGRTARTLTMSGLLMPAEWLSLLNVYNSWRNLRIEDTDTAESQVVGTTVAVTASANGITWANVACWFSEPPSGEQAGAYVAATVTLVNANEALQIIVIDEDLPDFGNQTLGSAVIRMTSPPEGRVQTPSFSLTATGNALFTGALVPVRVRNISGVITTGTRQDVLDWYDSRVSTRAVSGQLLPVTEPRFNVEPVIINGIKSSRNLVEITVVEVT